MPVQPWRREVGRYWRRRLLRRQAQEYGRVHGLRLHSALVTLAVGLAVALVVIRLLEARLRPMLEEAARTQIINQMTAVLEQAAADELSRQTEEEGAFIRIQRDEDGAITALDADTARLNLLRTQMVSSVLEELEDVEYPMSGFLWAACWIPSWCGPGGLPSRPEPCLWVLSPLILTAILPLRE